VVLERGHDVTARRGLTLELSLGLRLVGQGCRGQAEAGGTSVVGSGFSVLVEEFHFGLTLVIIATGEEARCSSVADARVGTALAGVRRHFSSTAVASAVFNTQWYGIGRASSLADSTVYQVLMLDARYFSKGSPCFNSPCTLL